MTTHTQDRRKVRVAVGAMIAGATAYMAYEAHRVQCRQVDLLVPGLPLSWSGISVLHLSDVHAGSFLVNERSLSKVVRWAAPLVPDLVVLTGDILGDPEKSRPCLELLAQLKPPLGTFAVTGNHEYGLGKGPLARVRNTRRLWHDAGVTLLSDACAALSPRNGSYLLLCGADYLTGGYGLLEHSELLRRGDGQVFPVLLVHAPPRSETALASLFPLTFAGHTHGGQLRVPSITGLVPLHRQEHEHLSGVHRWGAGLIVISRGVGVSFLPFRLLARPEATLWRLVYTSQTKTSP